MAPLHIALFTLVFLGSACAPPANICRQAEELIEDCRSESVDLGACTADMAAEAEALVAGGCEGLNPEGKNDVFSQACQGFLRKVLPWCKAEQYQCEPSEEALALDRCNGSASLCDRRYDEVVYATSHNAFNAATLGFIRPNQSKRMYVQLRDGMRALMLDVYQAEGETQLCHGLCDRLGSQPLREGLEEVRDFLECYPNEVVSLLIEPHTSGEAIVETIESLGLDDFAYSRAPGEPWPTLGSLIAADERLVIYTEDTPHTGAPSWYHGLFEESFDIEFKVGPFDDFGCQLKRGDPSSALFGLNHFITFGGGDEFLSILPNRFSSIMDHVERCQTELGRTPNFISVDFHDIGSVVEVVEELNQRL